MEYRNAGTQPGQPTTPDLAECNWREVIGVLDLNALPPEGSWPEEIPVPVPPQQGPLAVDTQLGPLVAAAPVHPPQVAAYRGFLSLPIIEVEVSNDESLASGFLQQIREINQYISKGHMMGINENREVSAGRTRILFENLMPTMPLTSYNRQERTPANWMVTGGVISYPTFSDDKIVKRKRAVSPCPEVRKDPGFSCPVCLNGLVNACSTNCGHVFCEVCIKSSIIKLKKCPTCRKSLNMKSFHRVYLPAPNHDD